MDRQPDAVQRYHLGVFGGFIEITPKGGPDDGVTRRFESEDEAVNRLADDMTETGATRVTLSSSCDFPEEGGRPDFDVVRFEEAVRARLTDLAKAGEPAP